MKEMDPEILKTFENLGIEPGESVYYPPGSRPTKPWHEASDDALISVLKQWGPRTFAKVLDEIRKRKLLPENEIRAWLGLESA